MPPTSKNVNKQDLKEKQKQYKNIPLFIMDGAFRQKIDKKTTELSNTIG